MKKIICFILSVMMILSTFSVSADVSEAGAVIDSSAYNVYIEGKTDPLGRAVTITLIDDNDNLGYIRDVTTDNHGNYSLKFKFDGNISDYNIIVYDANYNDITSTLNTAVAKQDMYNLDVTLLCNGNDVVGNISDGDKIDVLVDIDNKYGDATNIDIILAAYDADKKLIFTDIKPFFVDYNDLKATKYAEFENMFLPADTKTVKAFAWESALNIIPIAKEDKIEKEAKAVIENKTPENRKVIGLLGDSITHMGNFNVFLYQYYATRYPESNITFLNKGVAGDGSSDLMYRVKKEVFNETDPFYGECDEIILMIGMNDIGKNDTPEQARLNAEKCVANVKELVEHTLSLDKKIIIATPSLFDTYFNPTSHKNYGLSVISEGLKELGKEYNVPVIDINEASNKYTEKIRKNNPHMTSVITGTDSVHPNSPGGYLLGYLFVRALETNPIVASVSVDAVSGNSSAENAAVYNVSASEEMVSYTYLANSIPLCAAAPGYQYLKNDCGIDITNQMNREVIKVTNLSDGTYSVKMDGQEIGRYTASDLSSGINIAELEKNPGQIQSAKVFNTYGRKRLDMEYNYRDIWWTEKDIRKIPTSYTAKKYYPLDEFGTDFENFTDEMWYNCAKKIRENYEAAVPEAQRDRNQPAYGIMNYLETKKKSQAEYVETIKGYIDGMTEDSTPAEHFVEIAKVQ